MRTREASVALMAFVFTGGRLDAVEFSARTTGNWIVSETTSPLDYSPLVVAVNRRKDGSEYVAQLLLHCRNGRTSLTLTGLKIPEHERDYTVFYSINSAAPLIAGPGTQTSANDVLLRTDVERLLQSLPNEGELNFRLVLRSGSIVKSSFSLEGWQIVRTKLAAACHWPAVSTRPRN